jgi:hypothetical protein
VRAATLSVLFILACGDPPAASTGASTRDPDTSAPDTTDTPPLTTTSPTGDTGDTGDTSASDDTADPPTGDGLTYTLGGAVQGLQGSGLVLGGPDLAIPADGPFEFSEALPDGAPYDVTVVTQPTAPDQLCTVENGTGTITAADVTDILVTCLTPIRHVVILGIDGFGGAWIPMADTPVLDGLMAAGPHTLVMQNALPTMSAPNWMSMIAGSSPDQHGVDSNEWQPGDSQPTPTIFAVVREQLPAARIGVFHDWDGFAALVEPGVPDVIDSPGDEHETVAAALAWMSATRPELLFIHLDLVDHAGHFNGWGTDAYLEAGNTADTLVGEVLAAIDAAGMTPYTAVLVSADHGGDGLAHGADTSLERPIPFIVRAPQLGPWQIAREVRIWDLAATVVALLKLDPPASWIASPVIEALAFAELPPAPDATLELLSTDQYTWIWDDTGSGAFTDGSVWRPVVPPGYASLGDVIVVGHDAPTSATWLVRDDPGVLARPLAYEQVWNDTLSLGLHDVALWNPVPPLGYTCLGSVAMPDHDTPPGTDEIRCVHRDYLVPGDRTLTWTDEGSLALQDTGLWTCIDGANGGTAVGSFITRRHHEDPGSQRCWSIVPRGA